jgi:uncharacterized protein YutE (UPF0331/DUF86 family)
MNQLISTAFVKQALRIAEYDGAGEVLPHEDDDVIKAYIKAAQEAVLRYLKDNANETWTEETAPRAVRQAVLIAVQAMYDPDQMDLLSGLASSDPKNPIVGMLSMLRRPTLA